MKTGSSCPAITGCGSAGRCRSPSSPASRSRRRWCRRAALGDEGGRARGRRPASVGASGWSGAIAMKLAPNSVSGRVVNTSSSRRRRPLGREAEARAPSERPIQFACISRTFSGQRSRPSSASSRSSAIVGDLEEPLGELALLDQRAGAPAAAVDHLLVGEHGLVDRVPVDPALLAVDQPGARGSRGTSPAGGGSSRDRRWRARAIQSSDRPIDLSCARMVGDVVVGPGRGMDALLDGRVLGRQAEGVPAHGVQHIEAAGALVAGDHVAHGVVAHMAHVDAPRRIGEHLQHVVFRPRRRSRRPGTLARSSQASATSPRSPWNG